MPPQPTEHIPASGTARRRLLQALPAAAILGAATQGAAATTDLVLSCDTTLGPAMRAAATAFARLGGVRVNVFPTPPGLILPQLRRQVQNDIVLTQTTTMDAAVRTGVVANGAPRGAWRNRIVIAARNGTAAGTNRPIAVTDPTPAADIDGPAILARLGLLPTPMLGVIDTDTVADLVRSGIARAGLMHMTDVRAQTGLSVIRVVPPAIQPPIAYTVAVTTLTRRPHPAAFVRFLLSAQTAPLLAGHGLETVS